MHTPLDEHLHSEDCNVIIRQLMQCYKEHSKFSQAIFGYCDKLDVQMRKCTKQERLARTEAEHKASLVRRKEILKKVDEFKSSTGKDGKKNSLDDMYQEVLRQKAEEEKKRQQQSQ